MLLESDRSIVWARRMLILSLIVVLIAAIVPHGSKVETVQVLSIDLDKILHFIGFGCMGLFALGAGRGLVHWKRLMIVFSVLALGIGLEFVHYFLPYRTFNPVDIFANVCGVGAGVLLGRMIVHQRTEDG